MARSSGAGLPIDRVRSRRSYGAIGNGLAERIGRPFMRMPAAKAAMPAGDFRDWPEIDAWADGIAEQLAAPPVSA